MPGKDTTVILPLPADFDRETFLDFHRRDTQSVAEKIDAACLQKAFIWQHQPALLSVDFARAGGAACLENKGGLLFIGLGEPAANRPSPKPVVLKEGKFFQIIET